MDNYSLGAVIGADGLKAMAYTNIDDFYSGMDVVFLDARDIGLKTGTNTISWRGKVVRFNPTGTVVVKLQKFNPRTREKLDDVILEEDWSYHRLAPYAPVMSLYDLCLSKQTQATPLG